MSESTLWDKTYENCYYELIDGLYSVAGFQERLSFFERNNEDLIKEIVGECERHSYYISTQIQRINLYEVITQVI